MVYVCMQGVVPHCAVCKYRMYVHVKMSETLYVRCLEESIVSLVQHLHTHAFLRWGEGGLLINANLMNA